MKNTASRLLSLFAFALFISACTPPPPPALAEGQTWTVKSRPSDGATTMTLLHIEHGTPLGDIAVVSINNAVITLPDKRQANQIWTVIFTLDAVKQSLKDFQFNQGRKISWEADLEAWKQLAARGRAAEFTYTMPLAQALDAFEHGQTGPWAIAHRASL